MFTAPCFCCIFLRMTGTIIYNSEYHCQAAIELGKIGMSIAQIASEFGVSRRCVYNWRESHPEFGEAIEVSQTHAQAFYERRGNQLLDDGASSGQAAIYKLIMGSRFRDDYRDSRAVELSGETTTTHGGKIGFSVEYVAPMMAADETIVSDAADDVDDEA